jgi:hypothetical protein
MTLPSEFTGNFWLFMGRYYEHKSYALLDAKMKG